ncbi:hypothetical protein MLS36_16815 [Escherichia coli]|nr:hypothetical protein [Escherichia coli]MCN2905599.1 hypothetical protein [Escherichia coli]
MIYRGLNRALAIL